MRILVRLACFFLLLISGLLPTAASPNFEFLPPDGSVGSLRGVKVPLGSDAGSPSAYLFCREVTMERRQWGAFRIGVLPQVLSGVKLQLLPCRESNTWVADLHRFLTGDKFFRGVHMREFTVEDSSGRTVLKAEKAAFGSGNDSIELKEFFLHAAPDQPKPNKYDQALLWLIGPKAGFLQLTNDSVELIRIAP